MTIACGCRLPNKIQWFIQDNITKESLDVIIILFIDNANMNSDIPLETTAIFFLSKLYLKQGIGKVYVIVNFIA